LAAEWIRESHEILFEAKTQVLFESPNQSPSKGSSVKQLTVAKDMKREQSDLPSKPIPLSVKSLNNLLAVIEEKPTKPFDCDHFEKV
jgi:hypothetical protein